MYGDEIWGHYFGVLEDRESGEEKDFPGVSREIRLESSQAYNRQDDSGTRFAARGVSAVAVEVFVENAG
jgi:hypothetical protein